MFEWTQEMVRFMRDAALQSTYHQALADAVCERLLPARHVCDAGCGLGFLSCELAAHVSRVTAADISSSALEVLRAQTAARGIGNIEILQTDLGCFTPDAPYDAMVFCMFGRTRQTLRIAKRCCNGRIVMVKKGYTHHRFSLGNVPLRDETHITAAQELRALGVPFALETRVFEMGQPFRSLDDAVRFFRLYSKDEPGAITPEAVAARLRQTGEAEFPLYLPQEKALGLFTIQTEDIGEELE